jgi:hypothetical protein
VENCHPVASANFCNGRRVQGVSEIDLVAFELRVLGIQHVRRRTRNTTSFCIHGTRVLRRIRCCACLRYISESCAVFRSSFRANLSTLGDCAGRRVSVFACVSVCKCAFLAFTTTNRRLLFCGYSASNAVRTRRLHYKTATEAVVSHNELLVVSTCDRIHNMLPPIPTRSVLLQQQKQLLSHNELPVVSTYDRIHATNPNQIRACAILSGKSSLDHPPMS